jgi:hypothetical protein
MELGIELFSVDLIGVDLIGVDLIGVDLIRGLGLYRPIASKEF